MIFDFLNIIFCLLRFLTYVRNDLYVESIISKGQSESSLLNPHLLPTQNPLLTPYSITETEKSIVHVDHFCLVAQPRFVEVNDTYVGANGYHPTFLDAVPTIAGPP